MTTEKIKAQKPTVKKLKLKAVHLIKGLKDGGEYTKPNEIFTTDTQTAESLIKRGGAALVEKEQADPVED